MLKLRDFYHLPEIDHLIEDLIQHPDGLMIIAGLGPRALAVSPQSSVFLPSGRSTIFQIILQEILQRHPYKKALVVCQDKDTVRIPRALKSRVNHLVVETTNTYPEVVRQAIHQTPDLLVIDQITAQTASLLAIALQAKIPVISQVDTVLWGKHVARQLLDMGYPNDSLEHLRWILTVHRLPALCPTCRVPVQVTPEILESLQHVNGNITQYLQPGATIYQAGTCDKCRKSGRYGETTLFDIYQADTGLENDSRLSLEDYLGHLIGSGHLSIDDMVSLLSNQLRSVFNLLAASEQEIAATDRSLKGKLAELEAANRVMHQRTEVLVSLQEFGQALISSTDLNSLAATVCKRTGDLCGADRAILYLRHKDENHDIARVLAFSGWESPMITPEMEAFEVFDQTETGIKPYSLLPPGVHSNNPKISNSDLRLSLQAGLRLPLVAQGDLVGLMIVHTLRKKSFQPGEVALLQTFANQSALALQRAGLIDQLQKKIQELEAAHVELLKKERMEQELAVARQVQQSMLPKRFPDIPGYTFSVSSLPARQVGGDFYDVLSLDADHFGIAIADVSDKGMPASLFMALTRSLLVAEAHRELSPKIVLENVNSLLLELAEADNFVSIFYGVVDRSRRTFRFTRAGHEHPLLLRESEVNSLGGAGTVLGILETDQLNLSEEKYDLYPGDSLVLYTDGITDAVNPENQTFGLDRLKKTLLNSDIRNSTRATEKLMADLSEFQGSADQFDDLTVLLMNVH